VTADILANRDDSVVRLPEAGGLGARVSRLSICAGGRAAIAVEIGSGAT